MDPPLSVHDLPLAWLVQTVWKLDRATRLSLLCTCKWFMNLIVDSADSINLQLQPTNLSQEQMLRALQLVNQHADKVSVSMYCKQRLEYEWMCRQEVWTQRAKQLAQHSCSLLTQAQKMGYLQTLTRLEYTGVELATPWMPVFSDSCPNLTALTFRDSRITWQMLQQTSAAEGFDKLQELILHNVISTQHPGKACWRRLQQQVSQLIGLWIVQLTLDSQILKYGCMCMYNAIAAALTPAIAGQLTRLVLPCCKAPALVYVGSHGSQRKLQAPAAWQWQVSNLKNVQTLHLHNTSLDDALMQQLFALSNLTSVAVADISIQQSYRGQKCRWQQLETGCLRLEDFARLPLHSNLRLQGHQKQPICFNLPSQGALANIQEAFDNISTSKWAGWRDTGVCLAAEHGLLTWEGLLPQMLPLSHGVGHLVLHGSAISDGCRAALGDFIVSQQRAVVLDLSFCAWKQATSIQDMAQLIHRLPAGSSVVLNSLQEADVSQLCSAAQCCFALHVLQVGGLQDRAEKHMEAALLQSGCKGSHVHGAHVRCQDQCRDWVVVVNACHSHGAGVCNAKCECRSWAASLRALNTGVRGMDCVSLPL